MRRPGRAHQGILALLAGGLLLAAWPAAAETPAPSVHWGALAYPDQIPTLAIAGTVNRFTEFDNPTRNNQPYESTIHESFGLNFLSLSWTKQWRCAVCPQGLTTNLTAAGGPTRDQPSRFLQDIHNVLHIPEVYAPRNRSGFDGMIDGSVTKWFSLQSGDPMGEEFGDTFISVGGSGGTVYQEAFVRGGVRRLALPTQENYPVRFSFMGRYSWLFPGSVVPQAAKHSVIWQPAISFGPYQVKGPVVPPWEIEIGITWDSGLFVNEAGRARHERFWTASIRYHGFMFETWNDSLINDKDRGPTFGGTITYNFLADFDDQ